MENFWNKLKREWKTAAFGVVALTVEFYDSLLAPFLSTNSLLPAEYKWIDALVIPAVFLLLRRWRDHHVSEE